FSTDGRWLASGSRDGQVRIWDAQNGTLRTNWQAHGHRVNSLSFSANGNHIATAGQDGQIHVWEWSQGRLLWSTNCDAPTVSCGPGADQIVIGTGCGEWGTGENS